MTIEWGINEIKIRKQEELEAEENGSWEAWATMKRRRAYRRKSMGYSRSKAKAWMEVAEWELSKI
jgi:hypothetical protein